LDKYRGVIFRLKSTDQLRLKRLIANVDGVKSIFMMRDELIVSVRDDEVPRRIVDVAAQAGIKVDEIAECTPTLDLVYREAVSRL